MDIPHGCLRSVAGPPIDIAKIWIVFVHGLQGTWDQTWTTKLHPTPWPQGTLSRDLSFARIYTYGFDVMTANNTSSGALSSDLRSSLDFQFRKRSTPCMVVFVAHSLGGLIVQDMILRETEGERSQILQDTAGLIFIGCPSFKHDWEWLKFGSDIATITDADIEPDESRLRQFANISEAFLCWFKGSPTKDLDIWSFYETLPYYRMGIIVPKDSAVVDINRSSPLPLKHTDLSKIYHPWDTPYPDFYERLCAISGSPQHRPKKTVVGRSKTSDNREDGRDDILASINDAEDLCGPMRLALSLEDTGHSVEAQKLYEEVIDNIKATHLPQVQVLLCQEKISLILRGQEYGPKFQALSFCKRRISLILRGQGHYAAAEDQTREVIESIGSVDPNSKLILQSMGDLALIMIDRGNLINAYIMIFHALKSEVDDPYQDLCYVRLVVILAAILREFYCEDLSSLLLRKCLITAEDLIGMTTPFTLDVASELSRSLLHRYDFYIAQKIAKKVHSKIGGIMGPCHPLTMIEASRHAHSLLAVDRSDDAIELFENTLESQKQQLGHFHPDTGFTRWGLAAAYFEKMRFNDKFEMLEQCISQEETIFGTELGLGKFRIQKAIQEMQKIMGQGSAAGIDIEEPADLLENYFEKALPKDVGEWQLDCKDMSQAKEVETVREQDHLFWMAVLSDSNQVTKSMYDTISNSRSAGGIFGTSLHLACFIGHRPTVERLLTTNVDVNTYGGIFGTPLCVASHRGHDEVVRILLERGARPDSNGEPGGSALQAAVSMGHISVVRILLTAGADPNVCDPWFGTLIHEATIAEREDMVDILLEFGAKADTRTGILDTPIAAAARTGDLSIVKTLIRKGGMKNTQAGGRKAYLLALRAGHEDIKNLLYDGALDPKGTHEQD